MRGGSDGTRPRRCAVLSIIFLCWLGFAAAVFAADTEPDDRRETVISEPVFGGRAYVYEAGVRHSRSVVLIHGIGDNAARDWDGLIPVLAREFHVVTFDLPGFGRSSKANVLYSPANYVAFVKYVTGKYVHGRFFLLGHSMGGAVALRYAATYPEEVERLIVVDAAGLLHRIAYSQYISHLGIDFLPSLYRNQRKDLNNLVGTILMGTERLRLDPEWVINHASARETVLSADPGKIAGLALVMDNFSDFIPRVAAPTLIIWGGKDPIAPVRTGKVLAANIPHAQLKVFPDSAHEPMTDNKEQFNAQVLAYFQTADVEKPALIHVDSAAAASTRTGQCARGRNVVFSADYDVVRIQKCKDVVVRNARIRRLEIRDSAVEIEDSEIGGVQGGLYVKDGRVTMTAGGIEAPVAITAVRSHLDFAGVKIIGSEAAIRAPVKSSAIFSLSYISSPMTHGSLHDYKVITPKSPL